MATLMVSILKEVRQDRGWRAQKQIENSAVDQLSSSRARFNLPQAPQVKPGRDRHEASVCYDC